jgi:sec-independent protein translocase protein TatB
MRPLPLSSRRIIMVAMSFSDTIFLFFLALILFGPKKLPEIARQAGRLLAELRRASNEFRSQIESEIAHLEVEKNRTSQQPAFSAASLSPVPEGSVARLKEPATLAEPSILPSPPSPDAKADAGNSAMNTSNNAAISDTSSPAPQPSLEVTAAAQQDSHG